MVSKLMLVLLLSIFFSNGWCLKAHVKSKMEKSDSVCFMSKDVTIYIIFILCGGCGYAQEKISVALMDR